MVFYGAKTKLMVYFRLGDKDTTYHSTLDTLGQFIDEYGIPRKIIINSHSILGAGSLWKRVFGQTFTPLFFYEQNKQNHNPGDLDIRGIKYSIITIGNDYCAGVMAYQFEMWE